jgi:hypothetical protein
MGHEAGMGAIRNANRSSVGKSEWKIPIGRHALRYEANIKLDIKEIGFEGVNWIHLAQDRNQWWVVVNTVMNHRIP